MNNSVLGFIVDPFAGMEVWLVVGLVLGIFWVWQFVQLMMLEDRLFPGKHDKLLWAGAFIFVWPATPFAFLLWKHVRTAERSVLAKGPEGWTKSGN